MAKFKKGEIAHIDMDIDGERVASDVRIIDVPHKNERDYYVNVLSLRAFMLIPEKHLKKR